MIPVGTPYQPSAESTKPTATPGTEHPVLYKFFNQVAKRVAFNRNFTPNTADVVDNELAGFEGATKKLFIIHRKREARLRKLKIRQAQQLNKGHLICEVPNCGFNFAKRYGELGNGYAQVHHKTPLKDASRFGKKVALNDLAVVCGIVTQ
jgi:predicted HNH restriction endonuclease